jgi:hypothetical protein
MKHFLIISVLVLSSSIASAKALCGNVRCPGDTPSAELVDGCNLARSLVIGGYEVPEVIAQCESTFGGFPKNFAPNKTHLKLIRLNAACQSVAVLYTRALANGTCKIADFE